MTNNPTSIPLSQLEPQNAASFKSHGDSYQGRITMMSERQQTDTMDRLLFWNDGTPRMQWLITIEQPNGEPTTLYAKGGNFKPLSGSGNSMLAAIANAVKAAGAQSVEVGGELAVAYTGDAEASGGKNAAKLYTAQYRAPMSSSAVPVDLFSQGQPQQ